MYLLDVPPQHFNDGVKTNSTQLAVEISRKDKNLIVDWNGAWTQQQLNLREKINVNRGTITFVTVFLLAHVVMSGYQIVTGDIQAGGLSERGWNWFLQIALIDTIFACFAAGVISCLVAIDSDGHRYPRKYRQLKGYFSQAIAASQSAQYAARNKLPHRFFVYTDDYEGKVRISLLEMEPTYYMLQLESFTTSSRHRGRKKAFVVREEHLEDPSDLEAIAEATQLLEEKAMELTYQHEKQYLEQKRLEKGLLDNVQREVKKKKSDYQSRKQDQQEKRLLEHEKAVDELVSFDSVQAGEAQALAEIEQEQQRELAATLEALRR